MKFSQMIAGGLFATTGLAGHVHHHNYHREFYPVELSSPYDWIAGKHLFPGQLIHEFTSEYHKYDCESWAHHVLECCKKYEGTTSTLSYSAINSGTPKDRVWFGFCFGGGPTCKADYVRDPRGKVEDSVAYSVKDKYYKDDKYYDDDKYYKDYDHYHYREY